MNQIETRRKALQMQPRKISVHGNNPYHYNAMDQINPAATFDAFEIYDEEQGAVVDRLRRVAAQIVERRQQILSSPYPFAAGKILFLTSAPGHGKTHLANAIINHVADHAPDLLGHIVVAGHPFGYDHQVGASEYGGAQVVLIDDVFSNLQDVSQIHPATDVQAFMRFITMLYERRMFAIITSNFRLMDEKNGGILERVRLVDTVGRTLSRCAEVLAGSGEIVLPGRDFRLELAQRRRQSQGEEFLL